MLNSTSSEVHCKVRDIVVAPSTIAVHKSPE